MRIALIGMGSMGPGIAARLARGGHIVFAHDIARAALERATSLQPMLANALDALGIEDRRGRVIHAETLAEAVEGAGLVIENVPESEETKAGVYAELEPLINAATIVATDTSGIPITRLQSHVSHPGRFVGMHWSNPPHIIPMIEVIAGKATAPETVIAIQDLIRDLGLLPVTLKRDLPGFAENRVLYALLRECVDLVEQGVIDAEDIDTCVTWGIGYKLSVIGPMRLLDMAGLDVYQSVASFLNAELCDRRDVSSLITRATEAGRLGMKSGAGLFDYNAAELTELPSTRGAKLVAVRKVLEGGMNGKPSVEVWPLRVLSVADAHRVRGRRRVSPAADPGGMGGLRGAGSGATGEGRRQRPAEVQPNAPFRSSRQTRRRRAGRDRP